MWLTVKILGVVVVEVGFGSRRDKWISNVDGSFELAPQEVEEYEYEEEGACFGFR